MARSRLAKANAQIAEKVVGGYKAVEEGVVGAYGCIEDAFVEQFLTHDGESVEDAKARLCAEQEGRQAHAPGRQSEAN